MRRDGVSLTDPRIEQALAELQELIQRRFPAATFETAVGDDPKGVYLRATVDVADRDEVVDVFIGRLLEMQVEEELPVYVIPIRPLERVVQELRAQTAASPYRVSQIAYPIEETGMEPSPPQAPEG